MRDLFSNDNDRFNKYHIQYEDFLVDFSKNRITDETLNLLLSLAKEAGLDTGMAQGTAIIPIITGHSLKALRLSEALFNHGINAQPILYPAVPEKETRVRIFMTAAHSEKQIRDSVEILAREWERIIEENIAIA